MKKFFYILALSLAIFVTGCEKGTTLSSSSVEVVSSNSKNKGEFYSYDINIPQIKDETSEDFTYFNLTMQENMRYIIENLSGKKDDGGIQEAYKIFKDEAIEYFNMRINDMIKNKDRVLNTQGVEVIFFDNAEADINNAILSFEGDYIVFTFTEYDLTPYSSGMPVFKFNKKDIKKYLNF